jgi:hypothetical protein
MAIAESPEKIAPSGVCRFAAFAEVDRPEPMT